MAYGSWKNSPRTLHISLKGQDLAQQIVLIVTYQIQV